MRIPSGNFDSFFFSEFRSFEVKLEIYYSKQFVSAIPLNPVNIISWNFVVMKDKTQDENFPLIQLKHLRLPTDCSRNVPWNTDFRHRSVTFQWTFSSTECCWMVGTFQWPFRFFFYFRGKKSPKKSLDKGF